MMDKAEAVEFVGLQLRPRWPAWSPTPAEIADWVCWLCGFDVDAALAAVRDHAAECLRNRPIAQMLLDHARRYQQRIATEQARRQAADTDRRMIFIQCVATGHWCTAGAFEQIVPAASCGASDDDLVQIARRQADKRQGFYGGQWEVVCDVDYHEMTARRRQMSKDQRCDMARRVRPKQPVKCPDNCGLRGVFERDSMLEKKYRFNCEQKMPTFYCRWRLKLEQK